MGILRFYLAICVLANHSGHVVPWQIHDGRQAVQIFYMISGFYMAMVLSTRYSDKTSFYQSRLLRIAPPYFFTVTMTLLISVVSGVLFDQWLLLGAYVNNPLERNGALGVILASIANLTLVGQDFVMFLSHDAGKSLSYGGDFQNDASPLWGYLLAPQCWSVSVELMFYVIVPWLNQMRSCWLIMLSVVSYGMRFGGYYWFGLEHDPWTYRFFPFEVGVFAMGMLGYRIYVRFELGCSALCRKIDGAVSYLVCGCALLVGLYVHIRFQSGLAGCIGKERALLFSYPFWIIGIPVLFALFGGGKVDRFIGELSYPIYLFHFIIIAVFKVLMESFNVERGLGVFSATVTVLLAWLFYAFFVVPFDKRRRSHANVIT